MNYLRGNYKAAKAGEYGASMQKANAIGDIASSVGGLADSAFGNPFAKTAPSSGGGGGGAMNFNQIQDTYNSGSSDYFSNSLKPVSLNMYN